MSASIARRQRKSLHRDFADGVLIAVFIRYLMFMSGMVGRMSANSR